MWCIIGLMWTVVVMICGQTPEIQTQETKVPLPVHNLTNAQTTELLNEIVNRMDYRVRPNVDGQAVVIGCGFDVISFGSISDLDMDYSMDIFLRQQWYDPRLTFTNMTKPLTINARLIEQMWTPDLFFPTEKEASFHKITVPNKLMRIYPDGKVVYSIRLTLTLACPMDLTNFPMDRQECEFMMESYSYSEEDMQLEWFQQDPVELPNNLELPQFDLINVATTGCEAQQYKTGAYPCVKAKFYLKRQYGFHVLQTYMPSILIVIISWVSFWINMDAVPARIALGVTTVLTMATQLSGSKASIPRISYPKAIDIWMAVCMLMVFSALLEYAFVNALSRKDKRRGTMYKKSDGNQSRQESKDKPESSMKDSLSIKDCWNKRQTARMVDKISRILFPLSFVLFNLFYWPYFILNA